MERPGFQAGIRSSKFAWVTQMERMNRREVNKKLVAVALTEFLFYSFHRLLELLPCELCLKFGVCVCFFLIYLFIIMFFFFKFGDR